MDPMGTEGMVVWSDRTGAFHQKNKNKRIQLEIKFEIEIFPGSEYLKNQCFF